MNSDAGGKSALSEGLGRCATCKVWRRHTEKFDVEDHGKHAGTCKSDQFIYDKVPPQAGLGYWDYEGYSAGFNTGEDFGCVHWTAANVRDKQSE